MKGLSVRSIYSVNQEALIKDIRAFQSWLTKPSPSRGSERTARVREARKHVDPVEKRRAFEVPRAPFLRKNNLANLESIHEV